MNTLQNLFKFCLLATSLLGFPAVVRAQLTFTTNSGVITITGYTGSPTNLIIPNTTNGYPITSIENIAFQNDTGLTTVTIGTNVNSIGYSAFSGCTSLTDITIPGGVTNIGDAAFAYCNSLTAITVVTNNPDYCSLDGVLFDQGQDILIQYPGQRTGSYTIPGSVNTIGDDAFADCAGLTNITMGSSVSSIGNWAFSGCSNLTSVTISNPVNLIGGTIGEYAFSYCTGLTNITIPSNVILIGEAVFVDCTSLMGITVDTNNPVYSSVNGVLFDRNQDTLIQCPGGKAGNYTLPGGVTNIGDYAFADCGSLTNVTVGSSVNYIGNSVFSYCSSLATITIGTNVTSIGGGAFDYCTSLGSVAIPDSVTNIMNPASRLPTGDTFYYCTSLTNVTIGNAVTSIGVSTFYYCTNLVTITLGTNITSIGNGAFVSCTSLASITIPNSVTNIGSDVFDYCTGLTAITAAANNSAYSSVDGVLFDKGHATLIQYPAGKPGNNYNIPDSVDNIGNNAFSSCAGLISVTIPNGVTNIGSYSFFDCTSLTGIYFEGSAPVSGSPVAKNGGLVAEIELFQNGPQLNAVYYLPGAPDYLTGTTNWGSSFGGLPTVLWNPQAQTSGASFGVRTNHFGFNITGATNLVIVVEACTNLSSPAWQPVQTNTLTSGSAYFGDAQWTNYPVRYYRLRSP